MTYRCNSKLGVEYCGKDAIVYVVWGREGNISMWCQEHAASRLPVCRMAFSSGRARKIDEADVEKWIAVLEVMKS